METKVIKYKFLFLALFLGLFILILPKTSQAAFKIQKAPSNYIGLVGRWSFDGNDITWASSTAGTLIDTSGQGRNGSFDTMNKYSSPTVGKIGQAFNFDGVDDGVSLGTSYSWSSNQTKSVSLWVKTATVSKTPFGQNQVISLYINSSGHLESWMNNNGYDFGGNLIDNQWHHIVYVYNGSAELAYLDGVKLGSSNIESSPSSSGDEIGIGYNPVSVGQNFSGKIDEVRIYNRALSASEISQIYNSGKVTFASSYRNILTNGLVGLWTLDGADTSWSSATSGTAYDRSGQGNNGTINNSSRSTSVKTGAIGQALNFDQSSDNINMGNVTVLNGKSAATWSFWLYQTSYQSGGYYLSKDDPNIGVQESWAIFNENTGWNGSQDDIGVRVSSGLTSNLDLCIAQDADITLGQWMLVTVVFDGSKTGNTNRIKIYTNGVQRTLTGGDCNGTIPSSITNSSASLVVADSSDGTRGVDGGVTMDDIRIYNRALSDSEIKLLYNMGGSKFNASQNSQLTNGLVGLWSFNGADYNAASTTAEVLDRSGQGNNGDAVNGPTRVVGKVGQALSFRAASDGVFLPSDSIGTGTITFCAWVYPRVVNSAQQAFIGNERFLFGIYSQNNQLVLYSNTSGGSPLLSANNAIFANVWQHVCAVRNSGANGPASIYVNGVLNATGNSNTPTSGFGLALGNSGFDTYDYDGILDEVRIYNRALSAAEIKQLYNMGR